MTSAAAGCTTAGQHWLHLFVGPGNDVGGHEAVTHALAGIGTGTNRSPSASSGASSAEPASALKSPSTTIEWPAARQSASRARISTTDLRRLSRLE